MQCNKGLSLFDQAAKPSRLYVGGKRRAETPAGRRSDISISRTSRFGAALSASLPAASAAIATLSRTPAIAEAASTCANDILTVLATGSSPRVRGTRSPCHD
jgi:hypothetical protein